MYNQLLIFFNQILWHSTQSVPQVKIKSNTFKIEQSNEIFLERITLLAIG